jgi:hypothetical protein
LKLAKLLASVPIALLAASIVHASPITGTSGFSAPVVPGATATVDFETQPNATFSSLTLGGVTVTGVTGQLSTSDQYANQYNGRGVRYLDNNPGGNYTNTIRFDFASAVNAFAFNWGASDEAWVLRAFDAGNNLLESFDLPSTFASNDGDYVGLATAGIKYATLTTNGNDWVFIDNITTAPATGGTVPEPPTLALLGLSLLGFAASRRRKIK